MILITGGAGYIGSIVAEELLREGYEVVILDNLKQGHRDAIPIGAEFVLADIGNYQVINEVLQRYRIEAVIHLAADSELPILRRRDVEVEPQGVGRIGFEPLPGGHPGPPINIRTDSQRELARGLANWRGKEQNRQDDHQ